MAALAGCGPCSRLPGTRISHRALGSRNLSYRPRIGWDNQPGVVTQLAQGGGQAGGHVGEAAGLDQRVGLAAGHQDAQPVRSLAGCDWELAP